MTCLPSRPNAPERILYYFVFSGFQYLSLHAFGSFSCHRGMPEEDRPNFHPQRDRERRP